MGYKLTFIAMGIIFSQISITGKIPDNMTKQVVLAHALHDWACCMAGGKPPANFGFGMVEVCKVLGGATPEYLMAMAKRLEEQVTVVSFSDN